ncbi:MAG: hemolysin family protein [Canidatus Methanoxibalbensis ujae]|nr:hemolysin family protein [Candidatus Methanoxibalbensis ujae]
MELLVLFILLMLSAFFSGSETAFIGLGRVKARAMQKRSARHADKINRLMEDADALLTTVLIGNNLVNIAAASIATSIAIDVFGEIGVGVATGVMTLIILTFCEVLPKTLAIRHTEKFAVIAAAPLSLLVSVFRPVAWLLSKFANIFGKAIGLDMREGKPGISEEELRTFLDMGREEGVIEEDEHEMMESVLRLDEKVARDVMTPIDEMVCINADQKAEDAVSLIRKYGYSRIPVCEKTKENITGILYAKDMLMQGNLFFNKKVRDIMKSPYMVPETKRIDELLKEFQRGRMHIAIVVDEHGRAKGLVSLEDLLEEIVGSIYDEYDLHRTQSRKKEKADDNRTHA